MVRVLLPLLPQIRRSGAGTEGPVRPQATSLELYRLHPGGLAPPVTLDPPDRDWNDDRPSDRQDQHRPIIAAILESERYEAHQSGDGNRPPQHGEERVEAGIGLPFLFLSFDEPDGPGVTHNSQSSRLNTDSFTTNRQHPHPATGIGVGSANGASGCKGRHLRPWLLSPPIRR